MAKLTEADVDGVMEMLKAGKTQREVARFFGVCQMTISHIANGQPWSHHTGITCNVPA